MTSRLTALQQDLLAGFFALSDELFLTGGAALAGFWLGHRATDDLDLFGASGADLEQASRTLLVVVANVGARSQLMQSHPDFRRHWVERGTETCKVDLVIDRVPPIAEKQLVGAVRLDSMREIAANKVCALVGRSEIRDLVDLRALIAAGCTLEQALSDAIQKDGGADAATLAFLLDELTLSADAKLPGDTDPHELLAFRDGLVLELRSIAARFVR